MKTHTKTLAAALLAAAIQTASAADIRNVDGIAAVAGDAVITVRQLDNAAAAARQSIPAAQRPSENELRRHILAQLVNRALVVQAGKRRGITASEAETDEALAHAAAQKHTTVENLYAQNAKNGISRAALRKDTAEGIIAEKVRQQAVLQQARVSDAEVDAAIERAKQQGIALPATPSSKPKKTTPLPPPNPSSAKSKTRPKPAATSAIWPNNTPKTPVRRRAATSAGSATA